MTDQETASVADATATAPTTFSPRIKLSRPNHLRILAFGDSLTEGYTDFGTNFHPYARNLESILTSTLPAAIKIEINIEGLSGDSVLPRLRPGMPSFAPRLDAALNLSSTSTPTSINTASPATVSQSNEPKPSQYDIIIILGGTNDLAILLNAGEQGVDRIFESGLKPLYQKILTQTAANLIILTVPERSIDTRSSALGIKARKLRERLNDHLKQFVTEQEQQQQQEDQERQESSPDRVFLLDLAPLIPFPADKSEDDETPMDESIWSPDGLHMSAGGYDYVGKVLAEMIHGLLT